MLELGSSSDKVYGVRVGSENNHEITQRCGAETSIASARLSGPDSIFFWSQTSYTHRV